MKSQTCRILTLITTLAPLVAQVRDPAIHVNQQRFWLSIERLSEFGRPAGAGFEAGVTRIAFSEADKAARAWLMQQMREVGLAVRVDAAGNIFGRRAGKQNLPTLLFGSHIDSVPHGGNFDGDVGSLGALEVMRTLNDKKVATRHPFEIVVWTNEEGHRFGRGLMGSSAAVGLLSADLLSRKDDEGVTFADRLRQYGQDPARLSEARINPGSVAAYIELHIEQGGILEQASTQIGVVQGIVGIHGWECTAEGFANHAGTTPMKGRRDALVAASRAIVAVREQVRSEPGRQVGTVGFVRAEPGARNIIPGRVIFQLELRDLDNEKIARLWSRISEEFVAIGREEGVALQCKSQQSDRSALTDPAIQNAIREAARTAGYSSIDLPSGAGHDAQQIARLAPMGMIFVPSRGGISHSPREYSSPEDLTRGAEVLYRTLLSLDTDLHAPR